MVFSKDEVFTFLMGGESGMCVLLRCVCVLERIVCPVEVCVYVLERIVCPIEVCVCPGEDCVSC